MDRAAGILMHISSLPGKYGIGTFGEEAYKFVDFLRNSGIKYWQILPLGHTSYGDSPYQCFSAFAGNPYFIDFDILQTEGMLSDKDYLEENYGDNEEKVDYEAIFNSKIKVLKRAYNNFKNMKACREFEDFKKENSYWLEDYALFMSLKYYFNLDSWSKWDRGIKFRESSALNKYKELLKDEINFWSFVQFEFFNQWKSLKYYANVNGIKIIGDMPIYVAEDSADTWSKPENFKVDMKTLEPLVVAGCPPDGFSSTGQLWGNLIYNWDKMKADNYKWWVDRISFSSNMYDVIRIDHFRGFESYWEIPYGESTAINGKWQKGPALDLFKEIESQLGKVNLIAEDLGILTEDVNKFLRDVNYPGMKVLQFAFGGDGNNPYLPHNYIRECVAYTGTHDNDTSMGWLMTTGNEYEIERAKLYLGLNEKEGYNWGFIRGVWSSIANLAIAPIQDILALGNESRMNFPSTLGGNWNFRIKEGVLTKELQDKISEFNRLYLR